jgi:hypothetical protein
MMQLARLSIVWGGNYYHLPPARCWLLWDKKQNDQWTTAQAEMAWTNLDRPVRVFRMSQVEAYGAMDKQHPTQKPLKLMTWCIAMTQDDSIATVLDPFMGSGTTLRAAKDLGRKAIGIELVRALLRDRRQPDGPRGPRFRWGGVIGVQLSPETLTVVVGSLGGLAALAAARGNRTKALFDEHHWMYEQAQQRIAQLEQQLRDLRTEVEKWQRRAQDWRRVNGDQSWPE